MPKQPLVACSRLDAVIARLPDKTVTVAAFLADIASLRSVLPAGRFLLNACQDRYRFAVGFAAGLLSGKISLQPASQSAETLLRIGQDYPDTFCLTDRRDFDSQGLTTFAFPDLPPPVSAVVHDMPAIDVDQAAAILFTSGSTGRPKPHIKTWGKLCKGGLASTEFLGLAGNRHSIVGTVPVQHMFGFESILMLSLQGGGAFSSAKPFFPLDIAATLADVPPPRVLVTTPFHLATLLDAGLDLPPIDLILSATAPLSVELARRAEAVTGTRLLEIYGSTETGQLALRQTTAGDDWQLLDGIRLTQQDGTTLASGTHSDAPMALSDVIELSGDRCFRLVGRHTDMINIAGKRTSLAYLNHQITRIPGVVDATFFLPDGEDDDLKTRLAAFVVAPTLDRSTLLAALRLRIDAIFLPRPLVFVDALPRNDTGKLPRQALQALYARTPDGHR